ncbi:MAG: HAMP domain-containing histidine kinase [Bacteroidia bacterium]|nr:HAMP domain-containing histidine kinase [Bacteroidia bacterium]
MKLLTKTNIYSSITTILLFTAGIFIIYEIILSKLDKEADRRLLVIKTKIINGLNEGISPNEFMSNIGQKIYVRKIKQQTLFTNQFIEYTGREFEDDAVSDDEENRRLTQRELLFQTTVKNQAYEVTVCMSLTESKKIGKYIAGVVLIFLVLSFFILFFLNRYISDFLWSPFNDTLSKIKTWSIKKQDKLVFKDTDTEEFHLLNDTLRDLTNQIQSDYQNLKEFTENVSHEAQTPLSIISTKLELLLQDNNYNEKQYKQLQQIYHATQRMHKLNEGLILLTRIENKQFVETEEININQAINEKIEILEDFIEAKQITIHKEFKKQMIKELNQNLLSILLNNLFINAIKYNYDEGGRITVVVDEDFISIENTSPSEKIDRQFIYDRFNKNSISGSLGLGLSLIKRITDFFNWHISYSYKDHTHKFKIYL